MKQAAWIFIFLALLLGSVLVVACASGTSSSSRMPAADDDDNDDASPADDDASPATGDDDNDASPGEDDDALPDDDLSLVDDDSASCDITYPNSTIGLLACLPGAYNGYTLFAPCMTDTVYLIDNAGRVVHTWPGQYQPNLSVYLLEDGRLLRTGIAGSCPGNAGLVLLQDWDGAVTWSYGLCNTPNANFFLSHDVHMLPNGNILAILAVLRTPDDAVAAGRDPSTIPDGGFYADACIEIKPVGTNGAEIVWIWDVWDHLIQDFDSTKANYGVVADHPELIDINYGSPEENLWMHTNGIDFHAAYDQVLVSVRNFSEVWALDHSTTMVEAAAHRGGRYGHGGDLLYRWGNPLAYRLASPARDFYHQHNGHWIADGLPGAGDVLVFNNGVDRPVGQYSTADEFAPVINPDGSYPPPNPAYGPASLDWNFVNAPPNGVYSTLLGSAQRLANGNTLICAGDAGLIQEVTPAGAVVWQFINPVTQDGIVQQGQPIPKGHGLPANSTFRAHRFPPDFPGFAGQDLTPGACLVDPCP